VPHKVSQKTKKDPGTIPLKRVVVVAAAVVVVVVVVTSADRSFL